jgi:sortase (surface protein transpeptidase)
MLGETLVLRITIFLSLFKGEIETHQIARYDTRLVTVETIKLSQNNKQKGKQISREKVNE